MSTAPQSQPTTAQIETAAALQRPELTQQQQQLVHNAVCDIIATAIRKQPLRLTDTTLAGAADCRVFGSFVTLKRRGRLRSCCGFLGRTATLFDAIKHAATQTATQDVRLPPVSLTELPYLDVDVSLLYGIRAITGPSGQKISQVAVGQHGLQIRRGPFSGLLLPCVAMENGFTAEEFLRQVCRKAGLPTTAWQDDEAELLSFESYSIGGPFAPEMLGPDGDRSTPLVSLSEMAQLAEHCRQNVLALIQGATPYYYLPGCSDGTVSGVAIALEWPAAEELPRLARLSFRPGEPLQATLFNLVESAANALLAQRVRTSSLRDLKVHVTVLYDPAMHGTVSDVDFAGFDPRRRALLVMENAKTAWVFDPQRSPAELLESASRAARVASPAAASVLSLAALSTEASVTVSNVPRPQVGPNVRPPAVAGSFYPADAGELSRLLDDLLADGHSLPESWDAALLPHAGLRYSGRIAAAVLQRIKIPDTVIVIGPKHTRLGVEWAVAPHDRWSLPGGSVESDPELARQLADTIGGLQLDSLAHQQEHGIEVELPLLARLAPHARVVGIALGGGDLERCRDFASGLTDFVRRQPKRPLLIISSDMNHFATDQENRRLDEMALQALERLDPADLYQTVTAHNISMCGVLPAVIVLETLRQLETLEKADRVAYATTADVTGDKSRVVGYAGMLFR